MKKIKFFLDFGKEEKWLNEMEQNGYSFEKKSLFYYFTKTSAPGGIVKMDYRYFKNRKDFADYVAMFEDSGWKHISGTKSSGTQYFRLVSREGDEDIFSDARSRAGRYKRISDVWLSNAVCLAAVFIALVPQGTAGMQNLLHPKEWYFTPGLWEMKGLSFLWAFLFETPFAVLRACSWLLCILFAILYGIFGVKSLLAYRKSIREE